MLYHVGQFQISGILSTDTAINNFLMINILSCLLFNILHFFYTYFLRKKITRELLMLLQCK